MTRRGAALPVVLLAIAMTSALAVGGAYVTRQLAASARYADLGSELEPIAEQLLVEALASWDSIARSQQPIGTAMPLSPVAVPVASAEGWVTRTSETLYWLVAEASGQVRPSLGRRISVLVRVAGGLPALVPRRAWSELP